MVSLSISLSLTSNETRWLAYKLNLWSYRCWICGSPLWYRARGTSGREIQDGPSRKREFVLFNCRLTDLIISAMRWGLEIDLLRLLSVETENVNRTRLIISRVNSMINAGLSTWSNPTIPLSRKGVFGGRLAALNVWTYFVISMLANI